MPSADSTSSTSAAGSIEWVLFDVGGVLVELAGVAPSLAQLAPELTLAEFWRRWLYSPAVRAFETGRSGPTQFAHEVIAEFGWECDPQAFLSAFTYWPSGLFAGVTALLDDLPQHCPRALLSNSNVLHWSRMLGEMGLGRYFQHTFASHLTGYIKPDADAFTHVLQTLSVAAPRVLFLDDNAPNVEAARALGLQAQQTRGPLEARSVLRGRGLLRR